MPCDLPSERKRLRFVRFGVALLVAAVGFSSTVHAQKAGGTLRVLLADTPPSPDMR